MVYLSLLIMLLVFPYVNVEINEINVLGEAHRTRSVLQGRNKENERI